MIGRTAAVSEHSAPTGSVVRLHTGATTSASRPSPYPSGTRGRRSSAPRLWLERAGEAFATAAAREGLKVVVLPS